MGDSVSRVSDEELRGLLRFDSLQQAERITGTSYKEDPSTVMVGLALMHQNARIKRAALIEQEDSFWECGLEHYFKVIATEGFKKIFEMDIPGTADKYYVFWSDEGILLSFDTWNASLNGGNFDYNWMPNEDASFRVVSSHDGLRDGFISGSHDCREGIRFHLRQLRENGKFLNPWRRPGFLFTGLNRSEYKQFDHLPWEEWKKVRDGITASRVALFPEHVRKAILVGRS